MNDRILQKSYNHLLPLHVCDSDRDTVLNYTWQDLAGDSRSAAAVILLFVFPLPTEEEPSSPKILLTKRSMTVGSHKGHISFPGGRWDHKQDAGPIDTAIREMSEEVGLKCSNFNIIGALKEFSALDGSKVVPIIGIAVVDESEFVANREEVDKILLVDWHELARENAQEFSFDFLGMERKSFAFDVHGERVWGLTAAILHYANLRPRT